MSSQVASGHREPAATFPWRLISVLLHQWSSSMEPATSCQLPSIAAHSVITRSENGRMSEHQRQRTRVARQNVSLRALSVQSILH